LRWAYCGKQWGHHAVTQEADQLIMPAKLQKGIELFEIKDIAYLKANYGIKVTKKFGIDLNILAMDLGHSFRTWSNRGKIKCPKDIPHKWKHTEM